eukprot:COSAG03_NODE_3387_length_2047_cov_1.595483_3_plen_158_part_00
MQTTDTIAERYHRRCRHRTFRPSTRSQPRRLAQHLALDRREQSSTFRSEDRMEVFDSSLGLLRLAAETQRSAARQAPRQSDAGSMRGPSTGPAATRGQPSGVTAQSPSHSRYPRKDLSSRCTRPRAAHPVSAIMHMCTNIMIIVVVEPSMICENRKK